MGKLKKLLVFLTSINFMLGNPTKINSAASDSGIDLNVKVNEDVPNHLCTRFFQNLESLLNSTSDLLEHETGSSLSTVTIQLPASMMSSPCMTNITMTKVNQVTSDTTDVTITGRDPVFGSTPFTIQHGGCGTRGRRVTLPSDSLVQADNVTSDMVVKFSSSLVSHLYGVYPSHGYMNDSRYPDRYTVADVVLDNLDCRPHQSLFCSPHSYQRSAPTKQNMLCNYLSPLDIVSSAADGHVTGHHGHVTRVIRYVTHVATRYVLILDRSASMNKNGRWTNVHNALFGFITQLPAGDELSIVTFSSEARVNLDPTPVTESNKEGLFGRVPGRSTLDNGSCYTCAMDIALDLVSGDVNIKTVFVVVRGDGTENEEMVNIEKVVERKNIPVYGLIVGDEFVNKKEKIEGKFFVISDGTDQQTEISDVLLAIGNDVNDDLNDGYAKFYENKLRSDGGGNIEGKFSVEESLRSQMKVIITTHNKEDIEKFELVSPSGESFLFPLVERGSVYFHFRSDVEPGIWSYSITRHTATHLTISAYAKLTGTSTVTVDTWSSVQDTESMSSPTEAIILYTELASGALPVAGAEVEAMVRSPDGATHRILLVDSGTGYPDITAGDGIYSGYFAQYSDKPGMYSLTVTATDMAAAARIPTVSYVAAEDCCGSTYPAVSTIPSPPFSRIVSGSSFYVGQGAQYFIHNGRPQMRDVFPPVRVTDLHVSQLVNTSLSVTVSWTSPGDDFDQGTASEYQLKCSTNISSLMDNFDNETSLTLTDLPPPNLAGSPETGTVELEAANTVYYCGLVTRDEADNQSPVSNIVTIFVRQHLEEDAEEDGSSWAEAGLVQQDKDAGLDNMLIYIITGGGIIIVIILIFVIICITHKPKKEKKNKAPMITEISSPTLIHSSSALPGILKADSHNLSVLPPNANDYSLDYTQNKLERSPTSGMADLSWAILPSYSNVAFKKSSETIVDSGFYRAGEAVDNVYEFYQPSAEYAIYQQVNKEKKFEDISDNGTATTDCEISDTHSDKILRHFATSNPAAVGAGPSGNDFHSLIVTSEDFKKSMTDMDHHGPISLPHYSNFEDFAERRRRRESFV